MLCTKPFLICVLHFGSKPGPHFCSLCHFSVLLLFAQPVLILSLPFSGCCYMLRHSWAARGHAQHRSSASLLEAICILQYCGRFSVLFLGSGGSTAEVTSPAPKQSCTEQRERTRISPGSSCQLTAPCCAPQHPSPVGSPCSGLWAALTECLVRAFP